MGWPGTWTGSCARCARPASRSGISQAVDAAEILTVIDLLEREQLRHGLAAVLLQRARPAAGLRRAVRPVVAAVRPAARRTTTPRSREEGAEGGEPKQGGPGPDDAALAKAMRDELFRLLLEGDEDEIGRFARRAVDRLGSGQPSPTGQSYFSYRVMRALSPDTLVAQLLAGLLAEGDRGGLNEQVARQTVRERVEAFKNAVETEVRRRTANEKGRERVAKNAVRPLADQIDFLRAQSTDLAELRRTVAPLARRLAVRLSARRKIGRQGRLDFRKTVRASLGTGGVPVVTHHRPRKVHKPELVVLCDVSGSVAGFSHFTLMLTQALREHFTGVRAFAFVDSTDEVTRFFRPGADVADAVTPHRPRGAGGGLRRAQRLRHRLRGVRRQVRLGDRAEDLAAGAGGRPDQLPAGRPSRCWPAWSGGPARRTG